MRCGIIHGIGNPVVILFLETSVKFVMQEEDDRKSIAWGRGETTTGLNSELHVRCMSYSFFFVD